MNSFQGLPHRFEIFYKKKNLTFVNDSKATSFAATKLSLSSLKNVYWILGGLPKKKDKIEISKFKKNITKCFLIGKNIDFFKRQIKGKIIYKVTKDLENTLIQIFKEIRNKKNKTNSILLSPAAASFDQFKNFEKEGKNLKDYAKSMLENTFKFLFINYWRSIDKKILFLLFYFIFFRYIFFFSSTSSLAGERLNKDYYFFFTKHLIFTFLAIIIMIGISLIKTEIFIRFITPMFIFSLTLLALVPIIGLEVKGAKALA